MTDDELVLALDAAGWTLETSPRSGWIVLRRRNHIFAGPDLRDVANRIQRMEAKREPSKELESQGVGRNPRKRKETRMSPRYRNKKPPAQGSGDGVDISVGGSGAGPSVPGFGPQSKASREKGSGGHKSSQAHPIPDVKWTGDHPPAPKLPQEV